MNFAQLLFPDFFLIACGYLVCRYTPLDRTVWEPVERLVYFLLFPVLLFQSMLRSPLDLGAVSTFAAAGLLLGVGAIALAYAVPFVPGLARHIERREFAGSAQVAFRFNTYIGLALTERLLGAPGLLLMAVLIGLCVPLFNLGAVWPMARDAKTNLGGALLRNPLVLAALAGLAANLLGLRIPGWLAPPLDRIGAASLALGLMAAGAGMQFASLARAKALGVCLLAVRHLLTPLLALAIALALRLPGIQAAVLLLFAGLPTASSCYVLAARMGYNGPYVAALVTLSTVLGIASLPLALGVLRPLTQP